MYNVCTIMYTHIRSQASDWNCWNITDFEYLKLLALGWKKCNKLENI